MRTYLGQCIDYYLKKPIRFLWEGIFWPSALDIEKVRKKSLITRMDQYDAEIQDHLYKLEEALEDTRFLNIRAVSSDKDNIFLEREKRGKILDLHKNRCKELNNEIIYLMHIGHLDKLTTYIQSCTLLVGKVRELERQLSRYKAD